MRAAQAQGYPRLPFKKGHTVLPGLENWERFVTFAAVENLGLALAP